MEEDSTRARTAAAVTRAEEEVGSPVNEAPQTITTFSTGIGNSTDTDSTLDEKADGNTGAVSSTEPTPAEAKAIVDTAAADRAARLEAARNASRPNLTD